jgi:HNH endonuclease
MSSRKHWDAWLEFHPNRDVEWLRRMIVEGFDVHHLDANRSNNHPDNLVLIESSDHMRLHGLFGIQRKTMNTSENGRKGGFACAKKLTPQQRSTRAQKAVRARWKAHKQSLTARSTAEV